ncbi:hypothetical protein FRC14_004057 [Serendipita sp. 396]|nr:hypothetical protein FRC14_004057 [Serendipita sp. 396]KAG8798902.1 hypothetical protein FRC16_006312 [Serendipita sp. 398]KAG8867776.1 hypothetical protein FRC20_004899 [Serendipita sp. 405]
MDILDALQDIRARNARNERVDDQAIQDMLARRLEEEELDEDEETKQRRLWDEEDQKEAEKVFSKLETDAGGKVTLKRKADGEAPDLKSLLSESSRALVDTSPMQPPAAKKPKTTLASSLGIKTAKRRPAPLTGPSKAS